MTTTVTKESTVDIFERYEELGKCLEHEFYAHDNWSYYNAPLSTSIGLSKQGSETLNYLNGLTEAPNVSLGVTELRGKAIAWYFAPKLDSLRCCYIIGIDTTDSDEDSKIYLKIQVGENERRRLLKLIKDNSAPILKLEFNHDNDSYIVKII